LGFFNSVLVSISFSTYSSGSEDDSYKAKAANADYFGFLISFSSAYAARITASRS